MDKVYNDFHHNFGEQPEAEREFIDLQNAKLDKTLRRHGDKQISDHSNPAKQNLLRQEGGNGYIIRFLHTKWEKLPTAYTSTHPVPELQDRVFGLSATTKALVENQLEEANRIDNIYDEINKIDKRIFAVAYAEGERIFKCYKRQLLGILFPESRKSTSSLSILRNSKLGPLPVLRLSHPGVAPFSSSRSHF